MKNIKEYFKNNKEQPKNGHSEMDISTWFSLTRANYLVIQRALLESMPDEWQFKFVEMLNEMESFYDLTVMPNFYVRARDENGRFIKDPIPHYRHCPKLNKEIIKKLLD